MLTSCLFIASFVKGTVKHQCCVVWIHCSDHEFIEEQERHLYAKCIRTMALPVGRSAIIIFYICLLLLYLVNFVTKMFYLCILSIIVVADLCVLIMSMTVCLLQRNVYTVYISSCANWNTPDSKALSHWQSAIKVRSSAVHFLCFSIPCETRSSAVTEKSWYCFEMLIIEVKKVAKFTNLHAQREVLVSNLMLLWPLMINEAFRDY